MKNTARLRRLQAAIAEPARMIVIDERKGEVAEQERRMRAVDEFERSRCSPEQAAAPTASLRRRRLCVGGDRLCGDFATSARPSSPPVSQLARKSKTLAPVNKAIAQETVYGHSVDHVVYDVNGRPGGIVRFAFVGMGG